MLKLMRRTAMAERQAARRLAHRKEKNKKAEKGENIGARRRVVNEIGRSIKSAIVARHEAWELGPLAPRRDIPVHVKGIQETFYGTISGERLRPQADLNDEVRERRCAWAGGTKFLNIMEKDRVVVMEGPHKGRIAPIRRIDLKDCFVELDDVAAKVNVSVPGHLATLAEKAGEGQVQVMDERFPISAVRLVHPIKDEKTGITRDVIIKELVHGSFFFDRQTKSATWSRVVPGLNIKIPWPKREPRVFEDHPVDTLRIDVEEKTFVPTLLRPPMPEEIIDELRNRYSIFRTRHTPEYIAAKEAEDAEKERRKKMVKEMQTPLNEYNKARRELRKARGQPVLTEDMLEKIGEVIVKNRDRSLSEAGVREVATGSPPPPPEALDSSFGIPHETRPTPPS